MSEPIYICPECQGDGKETCTNPDHGFLQGVMSIRGANESACPCCGHDENYKVYYYEAGEKKQRNCDQCKGTGGMTILEFDNYCDQYGYDNEPELTTNSAPNP